MKDIYSMAGSCSGADDLSTRVYLLVSEYDGVDESILTGDSGHSVMCQWRPCALTPTTPKPILITN